MQQVKKSSCGSEKWGKTGHDLQTASQKASPSCSEMFSHYQQGLLCTLPGKSSWENMVMMVAVVMMFMEIYHSEVIAKYVIS